MKSNLEHELQKNAISYFRLVYPKYSINLFAIPNAGKRSPRGGKWMKDEGLTAGVSDLFLALPVGRFHGMFIEMKIHPNKPTDSQIKFQEAMRKRGYEAVICYSIDEFMTVVHNYIETISF